MIDKISHFSYAGKISYQLKKKKKKFGIWLNCVVVSLKVKFYYECVVL